MKPSPPDRAAARCASRIGRKGKPCGGVCALQNASGKALRRLGSIETGAIDRAHDQSGFARLQRIGNGEDGKSADADLDRVDHPVDERRLDEGSHGVMDENRIRCPFRQRLKTIRNRCLPARAPIDQFDPLAKIGAGEKIVDPLAVVGMTD